MSAAVPRWPRMSVAGSPGMTRNNRKTIRVMPNRTGTIWAKRVREYRTRCMGRPSPAPDRRPHFLGAKSRRGGSGERPRDAAPFRILHDHVLEAVIRSRQHGEAFDLAAPGKGSLPMIEKDEGRAGMPPPLHFLEHGAAFRSIQRAPFRFIELVDPLVLPLRMEGVGPLGIDGGEAHELVRVDGVAGRIAERHFKIAGFGGAVLRTGFDRLQLHVY